MLRGVVSKNQSRLTEDSREPKYLKIVNETFKESMRTRVKKEKSPNDLAEKARVSAIVEAIVTQRRVEKGIEKLRDEGVLPEKLTPQDMGLVAKTLNKAIHDDCVKEEYEKVVSAGEKFTKMCNSRTLTNTHEQARGVVRQPLMSSLSVSSTTLGENI